MTAVLPSVRVFSLSDVKLCLDAAVNLVKCFPRLERLYIKVTHCSKVCTHLHFWSICIIHIDDDCSNARGAFGWLAGLSPAGQLIHKNIVHVQTEQYFSSHNNQLEQYFDLFFNPVEQALG